MKAMARASVVGQQAQAAAAQAEVAAQQASTCSSSKGRQGKD